MYIHDVLALMRYITGLYFPGCAACLKLQPMFDIVGHVLTTNCRFLQTTRHMSDDGSRRESWIVRFPLPIPRQVELNEESVSDMVRTE